LEEIEPDKAQAECKKITDCGRGERDVTVDTLCTIEPVIDGDIMFNCDFSASKNKVMDTDEFTCDIIRHSVSKHRQYPDKA